VVFPGILTAGRLHSCVWTVCHMERLFKKYRGGFTNIWEGLTAGSHYCLSILTFPTLPPTFICRKRKGY